MSDRKDFYHQLEVSEARCHSNRLPFSFPVADFCGTHALESALEPSFALAGRDREITGDRLIASFAPAPAGVACQPARRSVLASDLYVPAFKSLLQGDHLGVEFALEGHSQLLESGSALIPSYRLYGSSAPPLACSWQALVIDDLVNIAVLPAGADPSGPSTARALHVAASQVYEKEGVLGSPEKDVLGEPLFQAELRLTHEPLVCLGAVFLQLRPCPVGCLLPF